MARMCIRANAVYVVTEQPVDGPSVSVPSQRNWISNLSWPCSVLATITSPGYRNVPFLKVAVVILYTIVFITHPPSYYRVQIVQPAYRLMTGHRPLVRKSSYGTSSCTYFSGFTSQPSGIRPSSEGTSRLGKRS